MAKCQEAILEKSVPCGSDVDVEVELLVGLVAAILLYMNNNK